LSLAPKKKYPNGIIVSGKIGALMWNINGEGTHLSETTFTDSTVRIWEQALDLDDDGVDLIIGVSLTYSYFTLGYERASINSSETNLIMLSTKF
jgi:hypothetical protein